MQRTARGAAESRGRLSSDAAVVCGRVRVPDSRRGDLQTVDRGGGVRVVAAGPGGLVAGQVFRPVKSTSRFRTGMKWSVCTLLRAWGPCRDTQRLAQPWLCDDQARRSMGNLLWAIAPRNLELEPWW